MKLQNQMIIIKILILTLHTIELKIIIKIIKVILIEIIVEIIINIKLIIEIRNQRYLDQDQNQEIDMIGQGLPKKKDIVQDLDNYYNL